MTDPDFSTRIIQLHPQDSVVVATTTIPTNTTLRFDDVTLTTFEEIPLGHKIALSDLSAGADVIKYGYPIGHLLTDVKAGQWIHTHNIKTNLSGEESYQYQPKSCPIVYPQENRTFQGYLREDGQAGIRNDLFIVPTVGCVNGIAELIIQEYKKRHADDNPFDHLTILKHPYGCSQLGKDHENTKKILADAIHHPNAGGVLVFGLGCENNTIQELKASLNKYNKQRVKFLTAQDVTDEIGHGVSLLEELAEIARKDFRVPVPLDKLTIGLKCGGSDGLSGITANPLLGAFSDYLISQGGSTILTEVPEMFGAEQVLMARAENQAVFESIVRLINDFKQYFLSYNEPVYENPSPGNKAGGISTLEDKSLGCTQKAGNSTVVDVLAYGEKVRKTGLSLLEAPGNDLVAASALASADCQLVLFTTGRGTPFGSYVPTLKVSTNTPLFERKQHWMDFDAGELLTQSMAEVLPLFIDKIIRVASGEETKNEANDVRELAIFKNGVTL